MKKIIITEKQARLLGLNNIFENKTYESKKNMLDESELNELVKYMYRESKSMSPFWTDKGLTFEAICDSLASKKMIVSNNGVYELSKSLGTPKEALKKLKEELENIVNGKKLNNENSEYAPEPKYEMGKKSKNTNYEVLWYNITDTVESLVKNTATNKLYFFESDLEPIEDGGYCDREILGYEKNEDGGKDVVYGGYECDGESIKYFLNDNDDKIKKYFGLEGYEEHTGELSMLFEIDEELKQLLLNLYSNNERFKRALENKLGENEEYSASHNLDLVKKHILPPGRKEIHKTPEERKKEVEDIAAKQEKRNKERLDDPGFRQHIAGVLKYNEDPKAFKNPNVKKRQLPPSFIEYIEKHGEPDWYKALKNKNKEELEETTTAGSVGGQYTAPAFSMKTSTEFSDKKPKAFKKTMYPGGGFVRFKEDCVKLNNKPAGSGCSQGAIDKIVSLQPTKDNITAPSLGRKK